MHIAEDQQKSNHEFQKQSLLRKKFKLLPKQEVNLTEEINSPNLVEEIPENNFTEEKDLKYEQALQKLNEYTIDKSQEVGQSGVSNNYRKNQSEYTQLEYLKDFGLSHFFHKKMQREMVLNETFEETVKLCSANGEDLIDAIRHHQMISNK